MALFACKVGGAEGGGELKRIMMRPTVDPSASVTPITYTNTDTITKDVIIEAFTGNEYSDSHSTISYETDGEVISGYGMFTRWMATNQGEDLTGVSSKSYRVATQHQAATFTCTVRLAPNQSVTVNRTASGTAGTTRMYQGMIVYTE